MPYFMAVGDHPRTRHTQFRQPDGQLYREELMGEEGFTGLSSLLYHRHSPSQTRAVSAAGPPAPAFTDNHPVQPRHFRAHELPAGGDLVVGRVAVVGNDDVVLSYAAGRDASPLYRNAVGDELIYIESGAGAMESVFGTLQAARGDYVLVPAAVTHRWVPTGAEPLRALIVQAASHIRVPPRYLSAEGQHLETAPFTELDLRRPDGPLLAEERDAEILVRTRGGLSWHATARHPFDVVGWFGCLYPWAFNVWDFSPTTGSLHRPPPVHQSFEGSGFVICNFVPRLFDYHPQAVPVPPYHANVDSDEVLFYADGDFMSRRNSGVGLGSITLHPPGFIHGPHPGSAEASVGQAGTQETAIMLDAYRPLRLAASATTAEDTRYLSSWDEHRIVGEDPAGLSGSAGREG